MMLVVDLIHASNRYFPCNTVIVQWKIYEEDNGISRFTINSLEKVRHTVNAISSILSVYDSMSETILSISQIFNQTEN